MPIENNQIEMDNFTSGLVYDPFEVEETTTVDFNPFETFTASQIISQNQISVRQFEEIARLRSDLRVMSPFDESRSKKTKQKPLARLLDEVATANKDVFDSLNKIQEEIDTLTKTKLIELANKHDSTLFLVIGKTYTLKDASEKQKSAYYNTLTQQLLSVISGVTDGHDLTLEDFKHLMLRHVSRFVIIDDNMLAKFNVLFEELYEYNNLVNEKKKEKRALMGRGEKRSSVCEDYINVTAGGNGGRESVRFSIGNY